MNKKFIELVGTVGKVKKDPFLTRERQKYKDPVASREFILGLMEEYGGPATFADIVKWLRIRKPSKKEALSFRLGAMVRDGQLMQDRLGRFCLFNKINLKRGTVHAHPDGYGFFIPADASSDMLLSAKEMKGVMHGDEVLVYQVHQDKKGRLEGKVHEIIQHANVTVVGRIYEHEGIYAVKPHNKHLIYDVFIPSDRIAHAKDNQIVLIELIAYPTKRHQAIGQVISVLGEHLAPGIEIDMALLSYTIPSAWLDGVMKEAVAIPQHVQVQDLQHRKDLRDYAFITIDGEDAKDFDDAVYCEYTSSGQFRLFVAIADVSHYVKEHTALDEEAQRRGTSVYFPGRVIPMLPEPLSNGICSLNPSVDRLAMVAEILISATGECIDVSIYRAVIHSHARLTYTQVYDWMSGLNPIIFPDAVHSNLTHLSTLYPILLSARRNRGAIDFEGTETQIVFDDHRKIQKIIPVVRNDAHRLIEECMLTANVAVAMFLEAHDFPFLYRTHGAPDGEKLIGLRQFLGEFSLFLGGGDTPVAKDFQAVLMKIVDKPERHLIQTVMLRSLKQAVYSTENIGHFGLAYERYTHFTSPIRRYPDLLVHRALGYILDQKESSTFCYTENSMEALGRHCSMTERRADEATREVLSWLKCEYMQDKLGQVFSGCVSGVTSFGLFVELSDIYIEGLVHITALKSDYYVFDPAKHRLLGQRTGASYSLGDKMKVLVTRVDLDERKIDFEPVTEHE